MYSKASNKTTQHNVAISIQQVMNCSK